MRPFNQTLGMHKSNTILNTIVSSVCATPVPSLPHISMLEDHLAQLAALETLEQGNAINGEHARATHCHPTCHIELHAALAPASMSTRIATVHHPSLT